MKAWIEHCTLDEYEIFSALYYETHSIYQLDDEHVLFVRKTMLSRLIARFSLWCISRSVLSGDKEFSQILLQHKKDLIKKRS